MEPYPLFCSKITAHYNTFFILGQVSVDTDTSIRFRGMCHNNIYRICKTTNNLLKVKRFMTSYSDLLKGFYISDKWDSLPSLSSLRTYQSHHDCSLNCFCLWFVWIMGLLYFPFIIFLTDLPTSSFTLHKKHITG